MALDAARAELVMQDYRYTKDYEDPSIRAQYPEAREIIIETNLDEAGGKALASDIFNMTKEYTYAFTFTIAGVLYPEDFTGGTPRYKLNLSRYPAADPTRTYSVATAKPSYLRNRTTITVRG